MLFVSSRRFIFLAVAAFVVLVCAVYMDLRGRDVDSQIELDGHGVRAALTSRQGEFVFTVGHGVYASDDQLDWVYRGWELYLGEAGLPNDLVVSGWGPLGYSKLTLLWPRGGEGPYSLVFKSAEFYSVHCSAWVIEAVLPVLFMWLIREAYRRRARQGCCAVCGYDLRASPERCPECGAAVAGQRHPGWTRSIVRRSVQAGVLGCAILLPISIVLTFQSYELPQCMSISRGNGYALYLWDGELVGEYQQRHVIGQAVKRVRRESLPEPGYLNDSDGRYFTFHCGPAFSPRHIPSNAGANPYSNLSYEAFQTLRAPGDRPAYWAVPMSAIIPLLSIMPVVWAWRRIRGIGRGARNVSASVVANQRG